MKTDYKYIHFVRIPYKIKTSVWACCNNNSFDQIATIKWYSPWRQYCIFTGDNAVFNRGCLQDITDFITQLMEERISHEKK